MNADKKQKKQKTQSASQVEEQKNQKPDAYQEKPHSHKGIRIFGLVLLMLVVLGGCAYGGISYYFADRFFEGTWINGVDCSRKTAYEVEQFMKEKLSEYSILPVYVYRRNPAVTEETETI